MLSLSAVSARYGSVPAIAGINIEVGEGDLVRRGQSVAILEAMKMEHVHTAPVSGTISAIDVAEGEQVTTGKIVVEIEASK